MMSVVAAASLKTRAAKMEFETQRCVKARRAVCQT